VTDAAKDVTDGNLKLANSANHDREGLQLGAGRTFVSQPANFSNVPQVALGTLLRDEGDADVPIT
jgi:hypothetical protein